MAGLWMEAMVTDWILSRQRQPVWATIMMVILHQDVLARASSSSSSMTTMTVASVPLKTELDYSKSFFIVLVAVATTVAITAVTIIGGVFFPGIAGRSSAPQTKKRSKRILLGFVRSWWKRRKQGYIQQDDTQEESVVTEVHSYYPPPAFSLSMESNPYQDNQQQQHDGVSLATSSPSVYYEHTPMLPPLKQGCNNKRDDDAQGDSVFTAVHSYYPPPAFSTSTESTIDYCNQDQQPEDVSSTTTSSRSVYHYENTPMLPPGTTGNEESVDDGNASCEAVRYIPPPSTTFQNPGVFPPPSRNHSATNKSSSRQSEEQKQANSPFSCTFNATSSSGCSLESVDSLVESYWDPNGDDDDDDESGLLSCLAAVQGTMEMNPSAVIQEHIQFLQHQTTRAASGTGSRRTTTTDSTITSTNRRQSDETDAHHRKPSKSSTRTSSSKNSSMRNVRF